MTKYIPFTEIKKEIFGLEHLMDWINLMKKPENLLTFVMIQRIQIVYLIIGFGLFMKTHKEIYGLELLEAEYQSLIHDSNTFLNFSNDPDNPTSINDNFIFSIYEDRSGVIWFGTNTGGVNYFHPSTQVFERFINSPNNKNSLK